jgi:carboxylesterase type B
MTKKIILAAMFSTLLAGLGLAQQPAPIKVAGGLLQGTNEDGLTVYRRIPFAAPPVQHLNPNKPQIKPADLAISDAMSTYWVNFAKHGNPNGKDVPNWPAFSGKNPVVMYFNRTPHTGPVPSTNGLEVLDGYFAWRRTPEGGAPAK